MTEFSHESDECQNSRNLRYGNTARPWDTSQYGQTRDAEKDAQLVHGRDVTARVKALLKASPDGPLYCRGGTWLYFS